MAKAAKKSSKAAPVATVKKKLAAKEKAPVKKAAATKPAPAKGKATVQKATTSRTGKPVKKATYTTVDAFIQAQEGPVATTLTALRKLLLSIDKTVGEQVKWNSPAYYYTGNMKAFDPKDYKRDIVVVNLNRKEYVLLIFPTGARIKDARGLLEGNYPDGRRMVKIVDEQDLKAKEKALRQIVQEWLQGVE